MTSEPRCLRLALFDLDHTLLPLDSDYEWGEFTIRIGWNDPVEFARRNDEFYAHYQAGTLDVHDYVRFATEAVRLRGPEAAAAAHQQFMREVITPAIKPRALHLIRKHQTAGDEVLIVTATNEFVTTPIAQALGVSQLLAVQLVRDASGWYTGEIDGIPPMREGKVDRRAAEVVATLKQAGFEAYIVGGAVRDLLLGLRPKDFDVATNATPEQVKGLFRRAFIIGKRFRIVHVVHGRGREHEVIEVSTFRAYLDNAAAGQVAGNEKTSKAQLSGMQHAVDASGRVLRDNVWGPQDEDATRRDFTVNAMYYDQVSQIVVDYHKGLQDAKKKTLRMIGVPATRYREDPVRIIRAVRFAAKLRGLGFSIEAKSAAPLVQSQALLAEVPQSRMFDEMLKLLQTGHAIATIEQLKKLGMAKGIYPLLDVAVERADTPFVKAALVDTDRRVNEGKPVAPSFLLACVLWEDVRNGWQTRLNQ